MLFINNSVPIIGVAIMFYVMLSSKINTVRIELGLFFAASMALWVFLFWADWTKDFYPVWQTMTARILVLFMVLCVVRKAYIDTNDKDKKCLKHT